MLEEKEKVSSAIDSIAVVIICGAGQNRLPQAGGFLQCALPARLRQAVLTRCEKHLKI
jgi:hypothetical protein